MTARFPPFVCPRCRGSLAETEEVYRCAPCGRLYPIVAGIPDFRVFPDPWIGLEDDRDKARGLRELVADADLEEAVRTYWSITPSTPREAAERYAAHCSRARKRSDEWLELLDGEADGDFQPFAASNRPWLDLGCGTADLAAAAASRGRRVVGVDIALRWLVVALRRREMEDHRVRLVCACAEALPFPDASFDGALSLGLLAHVSDPGAVAFEARRVLAPGAPVALRTVNRFTLLPEPHVGVWGVGFVPRRWADAYVRWRSGHRYEHHRPLSPRELGRVMRAAGFEDVVVEAAPTLEAETRHLSPVARRLVPAYEEARATPGVRHLLRWTAPILEARGRRP